jgi:hypothetical protein
VEHNIDVRKRVSQNHIRLRIRWSFIAHATPVASITAQLKEKKQCSTKHYTENCRFSNINPKEKRWQTQNLNLVWIHTAFVYLSQSNRRCSPPFFKRWLGVKGSSPLRFLFFYLMEYIVFFPFFLFFLAIALSVFLFTDSDYSFGIFKLFLDIFYLICNFVNTNFGNSRGSL